MGDHDSSLCEISNEASVAKSGSPQHGARTCIEAVIRSRREGKPQIPDAEKGAARRCAIDERRTLALAEAEGIMSRYVLADPRKAARSTAPSQATDSQVKNMSEAPAAEDRSVWQATLGAWEARVARSPTPGVETLHQLPEERPYGASSPLPVQAADTNALPILGVQTPRLGAQRFFGFRNMNTTACSSHPSHYKAIQPDLQPTPSYELTHPA